MNAWIEAAGHQLRVAVGETIEVDRLDAEPGSEVVFERVLLVSDDEGGVRVGTPVLEGARVKARVVEHFKGPKLITFKYARRKRTRRRVGFRAARTRLEITAIEA